MTTSYLTKNIVLDEETSAIVDEVITDRHLSQKQGTSQAIRAIIREWKELKGIFQMEMAVAQNFRRELGHE